MINFSPINLNNYYKKPVITPARKLHSDDTVSFKGHTGSEKYGKNGIPKLLHQTMFFRDYQTKKFVVDYIKENFADKDKIKITVGACSTGEESLTLSMMLDSIKDKVNILGIDLGQEAIEQAKNKIYLLQKAKFFTTLYRAVYDKYQDSYLGFSSDYLLDKDEQQQKKLFKEFFKESENVKENTNLMDSPLGKMGRWHIKKVFTKVFQLKKGKGENCKFIVGDIFCLNKISKGEKSDVIFFSNALYHMVTDLENLREQKPNAELIMTKLATVFSNNLNKNGLVCFGEREGSQGVETIKLKEIMMKNGFVPIKIPKKNDTMLPDSIFYKYKENFTENVFQKID